MNKKKLEQTKKSSNQPEASITNDATSKAKGQLDNEYATIGYSNGFLNDFSDDTLSAVNSNITSSTSDATSKAKGQLDNEYATIGYSNGFLNDFPDDASTASKSKIIK